MFQGWSFNPPREKIILVGEGKNLLAHEKQMSGMREKKAKRHEQRILINME